MKKIKKGKLKLTLAEDLEDAADQAARSRRGDIVPPTTPQASLGSSGSTSRKRLNTWAAKPNQANGSGGVPPKKPKEPTMGGDQDDSDLNSDSEPSDNEGELPKKKLPSEQLLHKYAVKAMV